ncbi:hypothetical protein CKA55_07335 [Arcobacter suis]|uniref:Uncharacterized protein n=1 Tax=Arcobacter suis CECT 7833 TaxID=663365 RepID=A0AAD0WQD2_9BACT|nr:hypothetical protein [Arcobacter suis]AXX89308.1 hypothetical protein ASUIS_0817 [Arcobacter suis CECT 7833]RWS46542.1 hypothetical protein CKA55_07335 [Arcobacter suis]
MLNFVKKLTNNDFSGLVKEYEVIHMFHMCTGEVKKTFDSKDKLDKYIEQYEIDHEGDTNSSIEIRKVKYE